MEQTNEKMIITSDMVNSFLTTNNLDFEVHMIPQFGYVDGEYMPTNSFVPMRNDTKQFLSSGGFSKDFRPIQNKDAFKLISDLSGVTNVQLKNCGQWGNGAGVFAQVSMGDISVGSRGDRVGKYLSLVNSHDGSRALTILITPYRFFCMNQIGKAVNSARKSESTFISIRHNASAEERMNELVKTVHIADEVFQYNAEIYNKMDSMKINEEYVKETLSKLFPLEHDDGRGRTIWENRIRHIKDRFYSADSGRVDRYTAWNLYNAIQGTVQHESRNTLTKNRSVLMGEIAKFSNDSLTTVLEVCSSEHLPQSIHDEINALIGG